MFTSSNQWVLVGLTSYGIGCGQPTSAGVYTRVGFYLDWIRATTGNALTNATSSNSFFPGLSTTTARAAATTSTSAATRLPLLVPLPVLFQLCLSAFLLL